MSWKGESRRHSLARKGIKTARNPMQSMGKINYKNPKSLFFAFWKANIENDYSNFDFDKAFKEGIKVAKFWGSQAHLDVWNLYTKQYGYDSIFEDPRLDEWIEDREMTLREVIAEDHRIMNRDLEFADLIHRLQNPPLELKEKIYLMDELIHTTHVTGTIWMDEFNEKIDVEELREEFDQWYSGVRKFR